MPADRLPEDGELRLGRAVLSGKRVYARRSGSRLVAWESDAILMDAGRVWAELSGLAAQTGLHPVLSDAELEEYLDVGGLAGLDRLDAGEILTRRWEHRAEGDGDPDADEWIAGLHRAAADRGSGAQGGGGVVGFRRDGLGRTCAPESSGECRGDRLTDHRSARLGILMGLMCRPCKPSSSRAGSGVDRRDRRSSSHRVGPDCQRR
jgi:hypothetical protein